MEWAWCGRADWPVEAGIVTASGHGHGGIMDVQAGIRIQARAGGLY